MEKIKALVAQAKKDLGSAWSGNRDYERILRWLIRELEKELEALDE